MNEAHASLLTLELLEKIKKGYGNNINKGGQIQIIYAGKAHSRDTGGKELIKRVFSKIKELKTKIKIVYLENYDMELGKLITSGSDL